ncbi:5-oxoprolinase subunit PxpB [Cohnella sp.]|uniref:5-oxoprolinase subunit PxpB n=1 Tax=Cohnella sp. TaxID=1883426 RepID=UPI003562BA04
MDRDEVTFLPLGDRAFTFKWRESTSILDLAAKAQAIGSHDLPWLQEVVPAYRTLTFHLRDHTYIPRLAAQMLLNILDGIANEQSSIPRQVELPVVYGGEYGPDLTESALRSGLSEQQFIERHAELIYQVALIGFAPGFPYLSGMDNSLAQPRRASPRLKVPAGSVGIAGNQTGVYPIDSPGGWQIIGRTAKPLFRPEEVDPFLLGPGDVVKFVPIEKFEDCIFHDGAANIPAKVKFSDTATASLSVLKPGLLTTIQDLGRKGWQAFGVSAGGAMDEGSMRKANLLIGNDEDSAVLEFTLLGGSYSVEANLLIALCGADLEASLNGKRLPMNRPVWLQAGTLLSFGRAISGSRCYMAVAGGIDVPYMLGSRSTDPRARIGGGTGRALIEGDRIMCLTPALRTSELQETLHRKALASHAVWSSVSWNAEAAKSPRDIKVRVLLGAEWDTFISDSQKSLFKDKYRLEVSSDRMGLRLAGTILMRIVNDEELESHGVTPGTIQVPPNGQPIILCAGCQPTGGYPKIAHVISADMPLLALAVPGDWVSFELTDSWTAHQALLDRDRKLAVLRAGIQLAHAREIHAEGVLR